MNHRRHRKQSRGRWLVAVAAALAVLVLVVAMAWADRDTDREDAASGVTAGSGTAATLGEEASAIDSARSPSVTPSPQRESPSGSAPVQDAELTVEAGATEAEPLDAVPLSGSYRPGATLRVQLADGAGDWSAYPLGIVVDAEGHFSTYVELGRAGVNRLRMVEPATGITSNEVVVTVR